MNEWVVYISVLFHWVSISLSDWLSRPPPKWPKLCRMGHNWILLIHSLID